ncbi:MAG: transcriptional regulator, AraC family [Chitinophagaceae bacterium]|nr:transcriptional regulator, AraC family [Chitinophagaceae bacterium]
MSPFLVIALYFSCVYKTPLYIIQPKLNGTVLSFPIFSYTDSIHGGKSTISVIKDTPHELAYRYTLKEGYKYKFAYVSYLMPDSAYLDLSAYNEIKVNIKAKYGSRIQLVLNAYLDDYTKPDQSMTYSLSQYILNVTGKSKDIVVPYTELYTPDWWFTENNTTEKEFKAPDFSKVTQLSFSNCINLNNGIEDTVEVDELSFHVNLFSFYLYSSIFLMLYFLIVAFFLFRKKIEYVPIVNFKEEKIETTNYFNEEERVLFDYLTTHYYQQELTIIDVQEATGVAERKISAMIKEKTNLNFKQFLNKLRTVEAKRLLAQTDLQVSEVAFKVGYSNVSHFNRVFKTFENCSPNDYRKEHPIQR